jgi:predicted Zn-dependent protease
MGAAVAAPSFAAPALADEQSQERSIGQQVYDDQLKKGQIIDRSPYYPVLRAVGARISIAAQPHWWPANFVIVKGNQANAFSVPGGWVYVNETLLKKAGSEEELAAVVGHETGHIVLGHVMNRLRQAQNLNLLFGIASIFIHTQGAANAFNLAELGANYGFLNFSRQQEYQADHEGSILAAKANYNPYGMIWFFQTLQKLYGNSGFESYVQDHPSTADRIHRLQQFFNANPSKFGTWSNNRATATGLRVSSGSDARIMLKATQ